MLQSVSVLPGSWSMIAQRRSGTHYLAHVVDYANLGSVHTKCGKWGRVIEHLGQLPSTSVVCKTCLKRAGAKK